MAKEGEEPKKKEDEVKVWKKEEDENYMKMVSWLQLRQ